MKQEPMEPRYDHSNRLEGTGHSEAFMDIDRQRSKRGYNINRSGDLGFRSIRNYLHEDHERRGLREALVAIKSSVAKLNEEPKELGIDHINLTAAEYDYLVAVMHMRIGHIAGQPHIVLRPAKQDELVFAVDLICKLDI